MKEGLNKPEEKETELEHSIKLVTDSFWGDFLRKNVDNIEKEKYGALHINFENEIRDFIDIVKKERGENKEYTKKFGEILKYNIKHCWIIVPDKIKDPGVKKGASELVDREYPDIHI